MNKTIMPLKKFKMIAIWFLIAVAVALAIVGIIMELTRKEKPEVEEVLNPVFKELPRPDFRGVEGLDWAKGLESSWGGGEAVSVPGALEVYKIAPQSGVRRLIDGAREIAGKLGLSAELYDDDDAWSFSEMSQSTASASLLRVNKKDLSWHFKPELKGDRFTIFVQAELQKRLESFLKEKDFYKPALGSADVEVTALEDTGYVLVPTDSQDSADFYRFDYQLAQDGMAIVSSAGRNIVVSATMSKYGELFTLDYALGEVEYDVFGVYPVRNFEAMLADLQKGRGVVVEALDPPYGDFTGFGEIVSFNASSAQLAYYQDLENGYLVPVWEVAGQAMLDSGKHVVVKVWLSGVSGEWLK